LLNAKAVNVSTLRSIALYTLKRVIYHMRKKSFPEKSHKSSEKEPYIFGKETHACRTELYTFRKELYIV